MTPITALDIVARLRAKAAVPNASRGRRASIAPRQQTMELQA